MQNFRFLNEILADGIGTLQRCCEYFDINSKTYEQHVLYVPVWSEDAIPQYTDTATAGPSTWRPACQRANDPVSVHWGMESLLQILIVSEICGDKFGL